MSALRRLLRPAGARRSPLAERQAAPDEGAALLLVLMVIVVVATLGLMLTSAVISQVGPARFESKNSQTFYAAETGLQATLSQLRSAAASPDAAGKVYGSPAKLPCSTAGTVATSTDTPTALTYSVAIRYFATDPTGQSADWQSQNALSCGATGLAVAPAYALLTSHGQRLTPVPGFAASAGDRTVTSLYTFSLTNANIAGGLMWTAQDGYCVQAVSASAGSQLTYVPATSCTPSAPLQTFQWDTDYRIRLSASVTTPGSGLCLTGVFSGSAAATLTTCDAGRNDQLFSYWGGMRFMGQNAANTDYSTICLSDGDSSTPQSGAPLMSSADGCNGSNSDWGAFAPDPKFGAGAAGVSTGQFVNYQQFGRCLDVTNENVDASYLIIYPCKQDPSNSGKLFWNHKFAWTEPVSGTSTTGATTFVVYPRGDTSNPYCLTTPNRHALPAYATFTPCSSGAPSQQWTRSTKVTGNYAASYTMVDSLGRCLGVGPPAGNISTIVLATCDGDAGQKWDAMPNPVSASVTHTQEGLGG